MLKHLLAVLMIASLMSLSASADDKPMTNADVISLVKAKMSEDTILMSIRSSKAGFDTSAKGIIALSNAGVPEPVVQAMIEANANKDGGGSAGSAGGGAGGKANPNASSPENVMLVDGGATTQMKYLTPSFRHAPRAFGWGGVSQYATLQGSAATLRLKSPKPSFIVAIPNNAQAESYFTIANFAVRNNNTREVSVGGGYYSYSTGINKDRVILATAEKEASQAKAPADYTMYRITPNGDLPRGEYAFILYNSQIRTSGWFASGLDSYFDFGVD